MILNYEVTVFKSILASFTFLQHAIFDDVNFIFSFFLLLPMQHHAASQAVTPASPGPARTLEGGHPLRPPLLPHLPLQSHRNLPPPRCIPCCRGDEAHPCQDAHCLCSHSTGRNQPPILPNDGAKKVLRLLPTS